MYIQIIFRFFDNSGIFILSLKKNQEKVGQTLNVLVEKESKKSKDQWAGRTDGNMWVVFDKTGEKVKDIVPVKILDTKGITLFGERQG